MQPVKHKDVIIIEVNYGSRVAVDAGFAGNDGMVDSNGVIHLLNEDMTNRSALVEIDSKQNWHVCPADLHLVKLKDDEPTPEIENVPGEVRAKIAKDRYYWVLKLVHVVPFRTVRARTVRARTKKIA